MQKGDAEVAALVAVLDGDDKFQLELGSLVGRFRKRRELDIASRQAADLLPRGVVVVMERQGCSRATAYRRASRLTKNSRATPAA